MGSESIASSPTRSARRTGGTSRTCARSTSTARSSRRPRRGRSGPARATARRSCRRTGASSTGACRRPRARPRRPARHASTAPIVTTGRSCTRRCRPRTSSFSDRPSGWARSRPSAPASSRAVRQLVHAQRARPVRGLRQGRRLPDHRERGRHQALRDEHPLLAPAPRVHGSSAGRCWLDRRGRPWAVVPRRRLRRPRERLHEPEHDVHDLEPHDVARLLRVAGGIPAHGNQRSLWDAGCRLDLPNPEHRS